MKKIYFLGSIVSIIGLILTTSLLININGEGVQVINSSGQNHTNININNKPQIPESEGEIGHFQESVDFTNFIWSDMVGKLLWLIEYFLLINNWNNVSISLSSIFLKDIFLKGLLK